jgi:threonine/homoserine/homoserine lactone efflux protein
MEPVVSLVALLGALALGAMSPGPSFVLVARTAIARSRADGLAAALGMGIGGVIFSVLVVLGLQAALRHVPALYLVLKVAGGIYLFYLGIRIWRGAKEPLAITDPGERMKSSLGSSFLVALGTQLSNPKTAVFYGSIFAALLPQGLPLWVAALLLPALVFVVEAGWYAIVALALSSASPRAAYLRAKTAVDRTAGSVLGVLGLKLVASARDPV